MSALFKKKAIAAAAAVTAAVLVIAAITHFIGFNPVTSAARIILSPFQSGMSYITGKAHSVITFLWEMDSYREENERLNTELTELRGENRDIAQFREENERLRELLELKNSMTGFSTVAAPVIGYSKSNAYDKIEIGRGSASGVNVGNTVITPDGVVGMVTEAGANWAMVTTVLDADNAMGVRITRTGDIAVLEGDKDLLTQGYCKMTFINPSVNIIAGDIIETSGSADIYPAGLNVGTVKDINSDSMGQISYATIEPSVDFQHVHEVLVINGVVQ